MIQTPDIPVVPLPDNIDTSRGFFETLKGLSFDDAISMVANSIVSFTLRLLLAIIVFYVGKFIIKKVYGVISRLLKSNEIDASLTSFILSLARIVFYCILIYLVISILGIETSIFVAIFASLTVAAGWALSGTLQNFAGGVLILFLKPYKVGDYIEAQGYTGTVKEILIFHTVINTMDNKTIIIPNGGLSTGSINNYSLENYRRVDWSIGLTYGCDADKAKETFIKILLSDDRVVVDTIQMDIEKRRQAMLEDLKSVEEDCPPEDPDCHEVKRTFWDKILGRNKSKTEELKQKLAKKISLNSTASTEISRPPFVAISQLADSSVVFTVRAWTHKSNYWDLYFEMNHRFYKELPENGFEFPFPQMDVHIADVPQNLLLR